MSTAISNPTSKTFSDLPNDVLYLIMHQMDSLKDLMSFLLTSKAILGAFNFNQASVLMSISRKEFIKEAFELLELGRRCALPHQARKVYILDTDSTIGGEVKGLSTEPLKIGPAEAKRLVWLDRYMRRYADAYQNIRGLTCTEREREEIVVAVFNMFRLAACFSWRRNGTYYDGLYDYTEAFKLSPRVLQHVVEILRAMDSAPPILGNLKTLVDDYNAHDIDASAIHPVDSALNTLSSLFSEQPLAFDASKANVDKDLASLMAKKHARTKFKYVEKQVTEKYSDKTMKTRTILVREPLRVRRHPPIKMLRRKEKKLSREERNKIKEGKRNEIMAKAVGDYSCMVKDNMGESSSSAAGTSTERMSEPRRKSLLTVRASESPDRTVPSMSPNVSAAPSRAASVAPSEANVEPDLEENLSGAVPAPEKEPQKQAA